MCSVFTRYIIHTAPSISKKDIGEPRSILEVCAWNAYSAVPSREYVLFDHDHDTNIKPGGWNDRTQKEKKRKLLIFIDGDMDIL